MFKMTYDQDSTYNITHIEINIDDENATLNQLFMEFIDMTRIMGYHAESWAHIINDLYDAIILQIDAPEDYNIYEWIRDEKVY